MPRKTISLDLRERIVLAYDNDEGTQQEIAHRFKVSWDFVEKLFKQRRLQTNQRGASGGVVALRQPLLANEAAAVEDADA